MRRPRRVPATAALFLAAVLAACSSEAPSPLPGPRAASPGASPPATVAPSFVPGPTALDRARAAAGVTTEAVIRGAIWLGFEACVGLTPDALSPYLPPVGQDDFVLVFPKGWRVVPEHPTDPRFGDHFQLLDATGQVIAIDGDVLEINGGIRPVEASHCGFGWPMSVRTAKLEGG